MRSFCANPIVSSVGVLSVCFSFILMTILTRLTRLLIQIRGVVKIRIIGVWVINVFLSFLFFPNCCTAHKLLFLVHKLYDSVSG